MKKRIFAFLLSLILVFNMMPITVLAVAGADGHIVISSSESQINSGDTATLTFKVSAPETPVGAINFTVVLPEGLEYVSHEILVTMQDFMMYSYDPSSGFFGCGMTMTGKSGDFDVLKVTVKAKDSIVGSQDVNVELGDIFEVDGSTIMDFGEVESLKLSIVKKLSTLNISLPEGIDSIPVPEIGKSPVVEDLIELVCGDEGIDRVQYQIFTDLYTVVGEFFEPGTTYIETIKVFVEDGYVIDQNTKLPDDFSGFMLDTDESSGNMYVFSRETSLGTVKIDKITIAGTIDTPTAFETIKDANLSVGTGIYIYYDIIENGEYISFPTEEKYKVGSTYEQLVVIDVQRGYEFADGFTVDNIDAPMLDGFTKTYQDENMIIFVKDTSIDPVNVEEIKVTGDIPARPALKEDYTDYEEITLTAENASVKYLLSADGKEYTKSTYHGDYKYIETIIVTPNEGYKFDENIVITFEDGTDSVGFTGKLNDNDGRYVFTRETEVEKLVIDKITVNGYTDPKTGEIYTGGVDCETEGVSVFKYGVKIKDISMYLFEGTKYLGDTEYEYSISFIITDDRYYKFAENVELDDADGFDETARDEISITFTKTIKTDAATVTGIKVSGVPTKANYVYGEKFETKGITVTAKYNDGKEVDIESMHYTVAPEKLVPGTTEVTVSFGGYTATVSGITVEKRELNITGLDATDRIYDGTTDVVITGGSLNGVLPEDEGKVYVTMPTAGTVGTADASAEPKAVTVAKPELEGEYKDYYTLADLPAIDVIISPKSLEGAVILGIEDVVYNSQEHKPVPTSVKLGETVIDASQYDVSYSADTKNKGTVTVTVTGKNNYKDSASTTFKITPATLTMDAAAAGKEFDGNKNTIIDAIKLNGVFAGDDVSVIGTEEISVMGEFASEFVGNGIAVTAKEEFTLSGADAGNYVLTQPTGLTANITAAEQEFTLRSEGYSAAINTDTDISKWVTSNAGEKAILVYGIEEEAADVALEGNVLKIGENAAAGMITLNVKSDAVDVNDDGEPEYNVAAKREFKVSITEKLPADIEAENTVSKTYGDTPFQIGATVTGAAAAEEGTWKWSVSGDAVSITSGADTAEPTFKINKAGNATVTVIFENRNYRGEKQISVSVAQKEIVSNYFDDVTASYEYTGSEIKHEIKSATLVKDVDYTVEYSGNINVGEATITIKGINNYTGTVTRTFDITAKAVGESDVSVDIPAEGYTYDGKAKEPEVSVDGLVEDTDYTVTCSNNVNAGTAKVIVEFKGNYSGKFEKEFEIERAPVTAVFIAKDKVYDGNTTAAVEFEGFEGVLAEDYYKVTYVGTVDGNFAERYVGLWEVTVTGDIVIGGAKAGNYKVEDVYVSAAEITAAEQEITVPAEQQSISQNTSKDVKTLINGLYDDKLVLSVDDLPDGVTFVNGVLSVEAGKALGEIISVRVNSPEIDLGGSTEPEYKAAKEKTITFKVVAKADAEVSVTPKDITKTFGDKNFEVALEIKNTSGAGKIEWVTSDSSVIAIENANTENPTFVVGKAGAATVTVTYEDGVYLGSESISITVNPKDIGKCTVAEMADVVYSGKEFKHDPEVKDGNKLLISGADYTVEYKDNLNAGTASVIIKGINNYNGTVTKTFKINRKDIGDIAVTGIASSYEYNDGNAIRPVVSMTYNEMPLAENTDFTVVYADNVEPGTAKVTVTGSGNYSGTAEKTFAIVAKAIVPTVEISGSYSYTGNAVHPAVTVKYGDKELSGGIDYRGTGKDYVLGFENNVNAGEATVTVTAVGERYTWTAVEKKFTIDRADYTVTVTDGQTVRVGKGIGEIVLPSEGNGVNKETVEGIFTVYYDGSELTEEASKALAVGDYTLTWKFVPDASETNYVEGTKSGSFTLKVVAKDTQTITTSKNEYKFVYGGAVQNIGAEVTVGDGALSYVSSDESVATVDANGMITVHKVGNATITITAAETTEFAKQTKEVSVVVSPKEITKPSANSAEFVYNGKDQTYEIKTNDAYTISGNVQKNAGTYTVTVELNDKENTQWNDGTVENITFEFVIAKAKIEKPNLDGIEFTYNGEEHRAVAPGTGYYVSGNGNKDAGEYGVSVMLDENYEWADGSSGVLNGSYVINKATVTVTAKNYTVKAGENAPVLDDSSYTVSGLAKGDELAVKPSIEYANTPNTESAGKVEIVVSGAEVPNDTNYNTDIVYVNGTLTVEKKENISNKEDFDDSEHIIIDITGSSAGKDDEENPNTGAPVVANTVNAGYAILAAIGGVLFLGKRK